MADMMQNQQCKQALSAEQLSNAVKTAKELCVSSGVRFTEKRQKLLEVLLTSATPLSAYELVDHYRLMHNEELQVMSAYRILEFLTEEHLVHKINLNSKYIACSRIRCCDSHSISQFMICRECEKVEEIFIPAELWASLASCGAEVGFSLERAHLEVSCVCHACQQNKPV